VGAKSGLHADGKEAIAVFLLRPFRLVRDPVHMDIWLTRLESALVDQPLFQRLRGIRQLAVSHLVYPGAVHTRFDHSLGTLFVADKITREAQKNCGSRGYLSDLGGFYQIREHDRLLIRLVALLHDVAHVPFGHLIEDEAGFTQEKQWADTRRMEYLKQHFIEVGFKAFIDSLGREIEFGNDEIKPAGSAGECDSSCRSAFLKMVEGLQAKNAESAIESISSYLYESLLGELTAVLKAEEKGTDSIRALGRPLIAEAVGNTICADLLDYLARDAYYTGLEERYDRRIYTYFTSFNNPGNENKPHMGLLIKKGPKGVRTDAARYIANLLDMRYALAQMVYTHPAKRMFSALAASMFGSWVMYGAHENLVKAREGFARGTGPDRRFNAITSAADDLILKMIEEDSLNTDDALLSALMSLDVAKAENIQPLFHHEGESRGDKPLLTRQQWGRRASTLARALKNRERWKRGQLPHFHTEIDTRSGNISIYYKNPGLKTKLTGLVNLGGARKMLLEENFETLLRKLFRIKSGSPAHKDLPGALVVLHVPKVFKPKEADVNVVLVHEDGPEKGAYAGPFKFLGKNDLEKIKEIGGAGSLNNSIQLEEQVESLWPMLGVLESTAQATVGLTVAEYYLHPKASEFLSDIGMEDEFTEIAALMVALHRTQTSTSSADSTKTGAVGDYVLKGHVRRIFEVLGTLAMAAGAKEVTEPEAAEELLAALQGKSQTQIDLPLAKLFD